MENEKATQLGMFPMGEGDQSAENKKPRKTSDLLARGNECIRLARSNKVQYALYVDRVEEMKKALKASGGEKWITVDTDFMPTGIARIIVKFVENYSSMQCELVREMKEIQAVLKKREIGFVFSDEIYPDGGC